MASIVSANEIDNRLDSLQDFLVEMDEVCYTVATWVLRTLAMARPIPTVFRENLVRIMHEKKVRGTALAQQVGVSTSTISKWRSGELDPDLNTIQQLADALCVSTSDLLMDVRAQLQVQPGETELEAAYRILGEHLKKW